MTKTINVRTATVHTAVVLSLLFIGRTQADAQALSVIRELQVGHAPRAAAADETRHRIYTTDSHSRAVSVIDTLTDQIRTISMPGHPMGIAVNTATNKIYVSMWGGGHEHRVGVIDGETLSVSTVLPHFDNQYDSLYPLWVAVDPILNRIYVVHEVPNSTVGIIDGTTDRWITQVKLFNGTGNGIAVNPNTNRVYVSLASSNVWVIDGSTLEKRLLGAFGPGKISVDARANRVYAASERSVEMSVIDGTTDALIHRFRVWGTTDFTVSPEGTRLYTTNYWGGELAGTDLGTRSEFGRVGMCCGGPSAVAVAADTGLVYAFNYYGQVQVVRDATARRSPQADGQHVTTPEDVAVEIALTASDPNGDQLSYTVVDPPQHGSLAGTPPHLTYTPNPNYFGSDLFTFKANDGTQDSNVATVGITIKPVNDPPSAAAGGPYEVVEGGSVLVAAITADVEQGPLTVAWDLDGDGTFESPGPTATFVGIEGPRSQPIAVRVTDNEGLTTMASGTVTVHNVQPEVGPIRWSGSVEPAFTGAVLTATADFTDPGTLDSHTATIAWGDGTTTTATIAETSGRGSVSATHTYTAAGFYTVEVTVIDDDQAPGKSIFREVVIAHPAAGTVSGSGVVTSPTSAFTEQPEYAGTANFTVSAKYAKNATVPSGVTTFSCREVDLSFSSSSYKWLVASAGNAWYRGTGMVTVNGVSEPAEFLVAAADGLNFTTDKLRMKIWTASRVVYDGQPEGSNSAPAVPAVTSGPASVTVR